MVTIMTIMVIFVITIVIITIMVTIMTIMARSGRRILVAQERLKALGFSDLRLYRSTYR